MSLLDYGQNRQYMDELRSNIGNVVPFFGAGASIPYGYPSWSELLLRILTAIHQVNDMQDNTYQKIKDLVTEGHYMNATEEMSRYWPNLENYVYEEISAINQINNSCLEKYIHLFPSKLYLTTNYDNTVERILLHYFRNLNIIIATSPITITSNIGLKSKEPTLYYLHGKYTNPNSIIFSSTDYNYFYGPERTTNIKSVRRQFLAKKLQEIYIPSQLLFIGCSMNMEEDRILKLLKKFNAIGHQPDYFSYALLDSKGFTKEQMDFKRNELLSIKVHPIWHSSNEASHEQAKEELFEYILGNEREEYESWCKNKQEEYEMEQKKQKEKEEGLIKLRKEIEESTEIINTFPYLQKYYLCDDNYEFALIRVNNKYYLSDQGKAYVMLDKIYNLKEPDVIKNLKAIEKECEVENIGDKLLIPLESWIDLSKNEQEQLLEKAKCKLFTCVSFMDKMRIFYV